MKLALAHYPVRTLLMLLVLVVVLPLAVTAFVQSYVYSRALIAEKQADNHLLAELVAADLSQTLNSHLRLAEGLTHRPELQQPGSTACNQLMADFRRMHEGLLGTGYVGANGKHLCTSTAGKEAPLPVSFADTEWFQRANRETEAFFSAPYVGKIQQKWIVVAVAPVRDAAGVFSGTINLPLDLQALNPARSFKLPKEIAFVAVVDGNGRIVSRHPHSDHWLGRRLESEPLLATLATQGSGMIRNEDTDNDNLYTFAPVEGIDWWVVVGASAVKIQEPARLHLWQDAMVLIGIALTTLLITSLLSRRITVPLTQLASMARRVSSGETVAPIPVTGPTEIATLAADFNQMFSERSRFASVLASRDRHIETLVANRDTLVREVHHRIKNHLQGLLGLIEDCRERRPGVVGELDTLHGQVLALASVHGMQARSVTEDIRCGDLLEEQVLLLQRSHEGLSVAVAAAPDAAATIIPARNAVPLALVLTELLVNARKYGTGEIEVRLMGETQGTRISISNQVAMHPAETGTDAPSGTGLALVKSLLVNIGHLSIRMGEDGFQASVLLLAQAESNDG